MELCVATAAVSTQREAFSASAMLASSSLPMERTASVRSQQTQEQAELHMNV